MISYPKQYRGGPNLVGAVRPTIFRDPPKAIYTRKNERVDIADVMYMVQSDTPNGDPTRINEGIQLYARGQNPMVEISYSNMGGGSTNTSLGNFQAHNPYKVEVVRPPLYPVETLQPISAPRIHQNYSVTTNPQIAPVNIAGAVDQVQISDAILTDTNTPGTIRVNPSLASLENFDILDRTKVTTKGEILDGMLRNNPSIMLGDTNSDKNAKVNRITLDGSVRPSASYNLDMSRDKSYFGGQGIGEANVYSVNSNITFNQNAFDTRQLRGMDPRDQVVATVLQGTKQSNIGMHEAFNHDNRVIQGNHELMRNFQVLPVGTNINFNELIHVDGNIRNADFTKSAIKDLTSIGVAGNPSFSNIVVYDPKSNSSIDLQANIKEKNYIAVNAALGMPLMVNTNDGKQIVLKDYQYSVVTPNIGNSSLLISVNQPDVKLDRNTPLFAATTNILYNNNSQNSQRLTQDQVRLDRLSNFGSYADRTSKVNTGRNSTQDGIGKKEQIKRL